MKAHNFYAGPAILPQEVLIEASSSALRYHDGLSVMEMSHRSKPLAAIFEEAERLVGELLGVPDDYKVLFLTGGASSQFYMVPMNILGKDDTVGFIDTGTWSTKAIKEAKVFGNVNVLASSKEKNFNYIPKDYTTPDGLKYLHVTSNNTIYGTQMQRFNNDGAPLVCDMSSDIFSRKLDVSKFDVIYAGAQKNLGPSGVTLCIIKKDIVGKVERQIPTMLNYQTHIDKNSMFNTPPTFPVYVCLLTLRWLVKNGGIAGAEKRNQAKADLLYGEIDRNPLFKGTAAVEDRSKMNVCFLLNDDSKNEAFLAEAAKANCIGLKGHRSVGGFRASTYNAMDIDSVQVLVDLMQNFEKTHG
jgi:phosphoserine aminotransferase